jgi:serine/threonine protein kinase
MSLLPTPEQVERLRRIACEPEFGSDRYTIERELAHGGMGAVYLAFDATLARKVAIKAVHPGDHTERLLAEARTLARLEHPGIIPVHDAGALSDGRLYMVMKYVEGRRLDEYEAPLGERLRVFARIVEAIAFAHSKGILHRDLKPHNVMVGEFGEVLVLDWGQPGAGTPGWLAPEHEAQGAGSEAGDIYALGLMLAELSKPFGQPAVDAIAARASHVNAIERYPSAEALRQEVNRYLDLDRVDAYRERWWQAAGRLAQRHQTATILVATYVVVRLLMIIFMGR